MEEEWGSHRNVYGCDVDDAGVAIDGFAAEQTPICKYFEVGAVPKPLPVFCKAKWTEMISETGMT